ncbi:MAG: TolC family protein [Phocaeicola sp.]|nr:TolC family protein [Phocaeicola sp.]
MKKLMIFIGALLVMSSCRIYKSYERPDSIDATDIYRDPVAVNEALAVTDTANFGNVSWREVFRDAQLQSLIEEGLANNVNMQAAILRVEEAKALLTAAHLSFLPSLALAPQGSLTSMRIGNSDVVKNYTLPAAATWEIDLFGKLLNADRGQRASYLQSKAAQQAVRSQLICGIANAYYSLLMLDRQVEVTEENVNLVSETLRTMRAYKEAGMTTEAAVSQTEGSYHQIQASLADLKRQVREAENSLSVLLGRTPQRIERTTLAEQVVPENLSVGVPVQLLSNRPDVMIAEMNLASAYYQTNQAIANFFPGINITGTAGWTNGSGGNVIRNPAVFLWQVMGQLTQPIFQHGKLVANLKISKREEQIAKSNYQQTILEAGKDVSNALYLYITADEKLKEHQAQVESMTKAVEMSKELFKVAKSTYLEIISAEQSLLNAQLSEVADSFQRLQAVINLYSALGGGRE